MRALSYWIPFGDAGTLATARKMRQLVLLTYATPPVRNLAARLAVLAGTRDATLLAGTIRNFLEDHVHFTRDPTGTELLQDPRLAIHAILTRGVATLDCDDIAMLAAALGMSVGLRARFVLVGFRSPQAPLRHVWTELVSGTGKGPWVEMDTSRPMQHVPVASIKRRLIVEV